jgi:hypothetical protein
MIDKLFSHIDFHDHFFEKWYEEYKDSDNFEDYMWYSMDEDIEEHKEENPHLTEEELKQWECKELKEKARDWFLSHLEDWENQLDSKCTYDNDHIYVYRSITVLNPNEFIENLKNGIYSNGYNGLGIFWSWDESKAESHWGSFSDGEIDILLKAKVHRSFIDCDTSLILNFSPSLGLDEAEFQLMEGNEIYLLSIEFNGEEYIINKNLVI